MRSRQIGICEYLTLHSTCSHLHAPAPHISQFPKIQGIPPKTILKNKISNTKDRNQADRLKKSRKGAVGLKDGLGSFVIGLLAI
ncbi:MAG TPA: hypothetical protein CFH81_08695 [Sulfurovum sp. UBA12169]|nr:MAG TPA: hypothetical protein CFH81_08695 [Sulfurovum sp. UBA12169]